MNDKPLRSLAFKSFVITIGMMMGFEMTNSLIFALSIGLGFVGSYYYGLNLIEVIMEIEKELDRKLKK